MIKPTLLIMAAGMGSRFGGLKQMAPVGPEGATLLDYSIFDAIRAGFGKVVFIIRRSMEMDFKRQMGQKWEKKIWVQYVFQEIEKIPLGFQIGENRQKPWGTGHAIWVARDEIHEPFAVINADDYYGPHSYRILSEALQTIKNLNDTKYFMVGFKLQNTLSEHGTVSRGVCEVEKGYLLQVVEHLKIKKDGSRAQSISPEGPIQSLTAQETVSMNMWGLTPALFTQLEQLFKEFLKEKGQEEKSEFLIPRVMDQLIKTHQSSVQVLSTPDSWFGLTYPEDLLRVQESIKKLTDQKVYPYSLGMGDS